MTEAISVFSPVLQELEKCFQHFNRSVFSSGLEQPTFVIQLDKKVLLRFASDSFQIVVGSELGRADPKKIIGAVVHEMIHVKNHLDGVIDCTSNQYHNKKFLATANQYGLFVVQHKTQGWGETHIALPSKYKNKNGKPISSIHAPEVVKHRRLTKAVDSLSLDEDVIRAAKKEARAIVAANKPRKACFLKYTCGCKGPHNSIRSGRRPDGPNPLRITCDYCGEQFKCEGT